MASIFTASSFPDTQRHGQHAILLGGFLLPTSSYVAYTDEFLQILGISTRVFPYNDPSLMEQDSSFLVQPETELLIGHSKGAKTLATWMTSCTIIPSRSIPCVLIEPVDVDPPGQQSPQRVLELWESNGKALASIPTLIVSAPYTQYSSRYGKAANLCAPSGRDSRAFFQAAMDARRNYPQFAAPLLLLEFPTLGHNDVTSSTLGGCTDGPGRGLGALAVATAVTFWILALRNHDDFLRTMADEKLALEFNAISFPP